MLTWLPAGAGGRFLPQHSRSLFLSISRLTCHSVTQNLHFMCLYCFPKIMGQQCINDRNMNFFNCICSLKFCVYQYLISLIPTPSYNVAWDICSFFQLTLKRQSSFSSQKLKQKQPKQELSTYVFLCYFLIQKKKKKGKKISALSIKGIRQFKKVKHFI